MKKDHIVGITGNESIIGSGVRIKGNLSSEHDIIIDGSLTGNVKTKGAISVGINAIIKGNLLASDATIAGQVDGDVKVTGNASIAETGQVRGNIASANLAIATGGVFIGTSLMSATSHQPSEEAEPDITQSEAS